MSDRMTDIARKIEALRTTDRVRPAAPTPWDRYESAVAFAMGAIGVTVLLLVITIAVLLG